MIKALIIEDEIVAANNLKRLIRNLDSDIEIQSVCESVEESVDWLKKNNPDIIFQDIQLADGVSFQIFDQIDIEVPIIFTTAFDQYAIEAFKQNSVDYLLKPIEKEALATALEKFKKFFKQKDKTNIDYSALASAINSNDYKQRFLIKIGSKLKTIDVSNIAYFFVQDKVVHARTLENRSYPLDISMTALVPIVDPKRFFRINRQLLIAHDAIESLNYLSSSRVRVHLNPKYDNAIVAIEKIVPFKKWLDS